MWEEEATKGIGWKWAKLINKKFYRRLWNTILCIMNSLQDKAVKTSYFRKFWENARIPCHIGNKLTCFVFEIF